MKMLKTVFPNMTTLANICLAIPIGTASVERSLILQKKANKNKGQKPYSGESSLSYLMKINIETAETLSDNDLYVTLFMYGVGNLEESLYNCMIDIA